MNNYFITGATGSIGSEIVNQLLGKENVRFYLLIYAKTDAQLTKKRDNVCKYWNIQNNEDQLKKFVFVKGDIRSENFGMSESDYERVTENCTHIIHCAGNVRMNLDISQAREFSINSVKNTIHLAKKCREKNGLFKKIEIVSTVGVGGSLQVVPESFLHESRSFHNTYEHAKSEAEDYIEKVIKNESLDITIHRPSMVVGNSDDGKVIHFQIFYHLCEFLTGNRTLGLSPDTGKTKLDTIPVDYVARAIIWSSSTNLTSGMVLHECSGPVHSILISDLKRLVCDSYSRRKLKIRRSIKLSPSVFKAVLPVLGVVLPSKYKNALKTLPVFLDYLSENQSFFNEKTTNLLSENGINLPCYDDYLEKVLGFYLKDK